MLLNLGEKCIFLLCLPDSELGLGRVVPARDGAVFRVEIFHKDPP